MFSSLKASHQHFGCSFGNMSKPPTISAGATATPNRSIIALANLAAGNNPYTIELFSRKPDSIFLSEDAALTPMPLDDGLSNLSAITVFTFQI